MSEPYCNEANGLRCSKNELCIATHSNGSNCVNRLPVNQIALPSTSTHSHHRSIDAAIVNRSMANNHHLLVSKCNDEPFTNGDLIDLYDHTGKSNRLGRDASTERLVEAINERLLHDMNRKIRRSDVGGVTGDGDGEQRNETTPNRATEVDAMGKSRLHNVQSMEQHQSTIREFKRLGTYCTLRPDQRRKHLLKVLPNLRNSVLLQTLLAANMEQMTVPSSSATTTISANNSNNSFNNNNRSISKNSNNSNNNNDFGWAYNDVDSLLIELDDFIIDRNTTMQHGCTADATPPNNDSTAHHVNDVNANRTVRPDDNNRTGIQIDPDKVEDCLLELDAYLEEIDRDYASACAGATHNSTMCVNHGNNKTTKSSNNNIHNNNVGASSSSSDRDASDSGGSDMGTSIHSDTIEQSTERTSRDYINCLLGIDNSHWFNTDDDSTEASTMLTDTLPNVQDRRAAHQSNSASDNSGNDIMATTETPRNYRHRSNSDVCFASVCDDGEDDDDDSNGCDEWRSTRSAAIEQRKSREQRPHCHPLRRGYKLRSTIAAFDRCDRPIRSNDEASASSGGEYSLQRLFLSLQRLCCVHLLST